MSWLIPPALLLLVFAHQRWRVLTRRQTAWKGGGFGMFSDIDRSAIAATVTVHDGDKGTRMLRLPASAPTARVSAIPTEPNIRAWGKELLARPWEACGDAAHEWQMLSTTEPVRVEAVTLRWIWVEFDRRTGEYSGSELASHRVSSD
jgi:hypothetical protein